MKKDIKKYYSNFLDDNTNDALNKSIENYQKKQDKELKYKDDKIDSLSKKAFNNKSDFDEFIKDNL